MPWWRCGVAVRMIDWWGVVVAILTYKKHIAWSLFVDKHLPERVNHVAAEYAEESTTTKKLVHFKEGCFSRSPSVNLSLFHIFDLKIELLL